MDLKSLWRAVCKGDHAAEEQLFQLLSARLRIIAQLKLGDSCEAEDVVQNAVLTILQKRDELDGEADFAAWAHRIIEYKILDCYKARQRRVARTEPLTEKTNPSGATLPDPTLEHRLLDCLSRLDSHNGRHARILNLHYQGYTTDEICDRLRLTRSNFYSILCRARSMLQHCLEEGGV
ncbi:MAG: sigma-70 family RNA polymerase sigma factor [Candidatus Zixiibacteriota bacterium]|nr:MAG: sigma-70 family RNA polymerase sigma factor [candidate division Zixibacteria bacterium]